MASMAVAAPQTNGLALSSTPPSPTSIASSTKRKRDDENDDLSPALDGDVKKAPRDHLRNHIDQKPLVRDYFDALRRYDPNSAVLGHLLPDDHQADGEPELKRQKSEDAQRALTIEDKVRQDAYESLEGVLSDISLVVEAQASESKASQSDDDSWPSAELKTGALLFKSKAHELFKREYAYPQLDPSPLARLEAGHGQVDGPRVSLMLYSNTSTGRRPLLTSLQQPSDFQSQDASFRTITDADVPSGVYVTRTPSGPPVDSKPGRSQTLGELFPSPRNLPPLQPPKPSKSTIKNNVLTFYHPELTNQSKYRSGSYFSQNLSAGHWLDYSNAAPSTHIKTKQRERAQSLAGHKPSSDELEMSEMEALFRGAFSSFAPCKDDSAAVIPSGYLSHMYWQHVGRRNFKRMSDNEPGSDGQEGHNDPSESSAVMDIDEELIQEAIDTWDESVVDPSLSEIMGEKPSGDKDTEDLLEEVSDLIETLASYQRNRNLTLPTSQDRHSTDPPNGDMLRHGTLSHQPSEEEMVTYEALKSQLSLIIQILPPFAVARINSDKLEELNISTKIQVRTNEYKGVMDEDEPAVRARQATGHHAASAGQRGSHRTPSLSGGMSYSNQYGNNFSQSNRSPMPTTPHYPQTPVRASPQTYQRPAAASHIPPPHHQAHVRPVPQQQYRTASNGYGGLAPQLAKSQTPYGHSNTAQYASGTATQPRMQPPQGYPNMSPKASTPGYPPGYQAGYTPQQSPMLAQHAQQRQFAPYMNGTGQIASRSTSLHGPSQQHHYSPSPTTPQPHQQPPRPSFNHGQASNPSFARPSSSNVPSGPSPTSMAQQQQLPQQLGNRASVGIIGYHTVMGDAQQQQVMDTARQQALDQARQQAQARHDAQSRTIGFNGSPPSSGGKAVQQGEIAGLAGIGLGGNVDVQKLAAHRANMAAMSQGSMSPSPKPAGPAVGSLGAPRSPMPQAASLNGALGGTPASAASPLSLPANGEPSPASIATTPPIAP